MAFTVKPKVDKPAIIPQQRNPFAQGYFNDVFNFGNASGITILNIYTGNTLYLNTISGSTNITVYSGAPGVIITELKSGITVSNITGGTFYSGITPLDQIFVTSGRSVCNTYPIFKQKLGSVLEFYGLSAGTNVTITTGNCITINASGGGGATTPTYVQPGTNTFTGGTAGNPTVNITAATLASLTVSGNTSLAAVSGTSFFSGSTPFQSIFVTSGRTLDTNYPVFKQKVGSVLEFRGLRAGSNVSLYANANSIYITSSPAGVYASNYWELGTQGSDLQRKGASLYTYGKAAFSIGANNNIQTSDYSFIGGQNSLIQNSAFAVSVGGNSNKTIVGLYNGILNGKSNYNYSSWGIIGGGYRNKIKNYSDSYNANKGFIGNGYCNKIEAENTFTSPYASIINGSHNFITNSQHSTITGGKYNLIKNTKYSAIINGNYNHNYGAYSVIGGKLNQNNGYYSAVFGNQCQNFGTASFISGTYNINHYGQSSVLIGGINNRNYSSNHFAIIGGKNNTGSTALYSIIGAGAFNFMTDTATYSMIGAGERNTIKMRHNFIGAGSGNTLVFGQRSAIIAGISNTGASVNSVIVGGANNDIRIGGNNNSIIGGSGNIVYQNLDNISIIASSNITAQTPNRVYVPSLRVNDLTGVTGYQMVIANADGVLSLTGITAGGSGGTTTPTYVQNGTNTFTGGTSANPTINITALTVSNITATGTTNVNTLSGNSISATTFYSGSTDLSLLINNASGFSGYSGYSGKSGSSGFSGYSGHDGLSGFSGYSGYSGYSGISGFSGYSGYSGISGFSGYSGIGTSGFSGYSGYSGDSGISGFSGYSGYSGISGFSGYSGYSGVSGFSGYSGTGLSGFSGYSGYSGYSGISGFSGYSGYSGISGFSGYSGYSGISGFSGGGSSVTFSNTGSTTGIYSATTGNVAYFKSLSAGTNINFNTTADTNSIIINSSYDVSKHRRGGNIWYNASIFCPALSTSSSLSANRMNATPLIVSNITGLTVNGLAFNVTSSGVTSFGVGIYDDNGSNYPNNLVYGGTTGYTGDCQSTGVKVLTGVTSSATLMPGLYWLCGWSQSTGGAITSMTTLHGVPNVIGSSTTPNFSSGILAYTHTQTWNGGTMPSTFPSSSPSTASNGFMINFRVA